MRILAKPNRQIAMKFSIVNSLGIRRVGNAGQIKRLVDTSRKERINMRVVKRDAISQGMKGCGHISLMDTAQEMRTMGIAIMSGASIKVVC